ncbi:MAG: glycerol-3-phosphate 1-O-acyltransferase PlsY [Coriobacteriia bacterium]|nr:glycerol-3-phosphate 1-O-acyltransferase PlsY [Coriobacteriia bacterium]
MAGILAALLIAYLAGGIPVAYIVGRVHRGIDIREHGSGNVGTTNAWRVLGPAAGVAVLVLDVVKGAVAVLAAPYAAAAVSWQASGAAPAGVSAALPVLAGLTAVLGHTYTPFLRFRGGKGIATAAGVLLVVTPLAVPILLGVFAVVVALTRMVSAGSLVIALLYPGVVGLFYRDVPGALPFAVAAAALLTWRHRGNIARIARGQERKVVWRRATRESGGER